MKLSELLERVESINLAHRQISGNLLKAKAQFDWGITIPGDFLCQNNRLDSLEGMPENVIGTIDCEGNILTDLKGCSLSVGRSFICKNNRITSLEFTPHYIRGDFDASDNKITNLLNIEETLGTVKGKIILTGNPISAHISGLLKVKGLEQAVYSDRGNKKAFEAFLVINKYLQKTEDLIESLTASNMISCEDELKERGLEAFI